MFYTHLVQFIAVYANTSVQFDEGTPLLPNFGFCEQRPKNTTTSHRMIDTFTK
jgi:hypothetical protein